MKRLACTRENVRTYARLGTRIGTILVAVSWISVAYTALIAIVFILCLFNPWLLTIRGGDVTVYGLQVGDNGFLGMDGKIAGVLFQFHDGGLPLACFGIAGVANAWLNVCVAGGARDLCAAIGAWAGDGGSGAESGDAAANGLTPFCADAQRGLERIGWGLMLKPVLAGAMCVISVLFLIAGSSVGVSLEFFSLLEYMLAGALMFLLSFVFGYGATLQRDVDGLL